MKFLSGVTTRVVIVVSLLVISNNSFTMDWFKKLVGWKTMQSNNTNTNVPMITIEERENLSHLILTITNIRYISNYDGKDLSFRRWLGRDQYFEQYKQEYATAKIDIDLYNKKVIISLLNSHGNKIIEHSNADDLWLIRTLFSDVQKNLLQIKSQNLGSFQNRLIDLTLKDQTDPVYSSLLDAYFLSLSYINEQLQKKDETKHIVLSQRYIR